MRLLPKSAAELFFGVVLALSAGPVRALDAGQLAVIVNTWDPLSVEIGEYYAAKRRINFQNFIKVGFRSGDPAMTVKDFSVLKARVDAQTMPRVQAYALTWVAPYRVDCMSMTSAFAFGFDPAYCESDCKPTRRSSYYASATRQPFSRFGIRPTMSIAATSIEQAKALIDRGVESDGSRPLGTAYLLSTSDSARNVRSQSYPLAEQILKRRVQVAIRKADALRDANDVLFYFTGKPRVEGLETLRFLPGAVADHLTSAGGQLTHGDQMSALRWLEAGATGSYGTVVEPCNIVEKFPNVPVLARSYLAGETLIEAYWKSVAMPGQGIFIGEPLASPFGRSTAAH